MIPDPRPTRWYTIAPPLTPLHELGNQDAIGAEARSLREGPTPGRHLLAALLIEALKAVLDSLGQFSRRPGARGLSARRPTCPASAREDLRPRPRVSASSGSSSPSNR